MISFEQQIKFEAWEAKWTGYNLLWEMLNRDILK